MALYTAFLDACVLVPISTCDTLLRMAEHGLFRPLWSNRVTDEAQQALEEIHPDIDKNRLTYRFRSMDKAFRDAKVNNWEPFLPGIKRLAIPDPDDAHVIAAALCGRADAIITNNLKDFPDEILKPLGLEAIDLDTFLISQFDLSKAATCRALDEQAKAQKNPPMDFAALLDALGRSAPKFAETVRAELFSEELTP